MYITQTHDSGIIVIGNVSSDDGDVSNNHSGFGYFDTWVVKLDKNGMLLQEHCFGGMGDEKIFSGNNIIKNNDYDYVVAVQSVGISGDVECELNPDPYYNSYDAWVINIKDCTQYQPTTPLQPTGKNHFCVNTDSITTYTTQVTVGAWHYEWFLAPEEAGTITQDSITTQIHWSPIYEGAATIKVRSTNDCGESAWSDSLEVQTYMCLGNEEHETGLQTFSIYPNPVKNKLTVNFLKHVDNNSTSVEILDMYGSIVTRQKIPTGEQLVNIDVRGLAKSLYFVRVIENLEIIGVRKVVVE